jgi:hypothetical protein
MFVPYNLVDFNFFFLKIGSEETILFTNFMYPYCPSVNYFTDCFEIIP